MKNKKVLIGLCIAIPVIGGLYLGYKFLKGPKDFVPPVRQPEPLQSSVASDFPIKYGSDSTLVKQLQQLLGVTADGRFGPLTQAALTAQAGKVSVANQAEFNAVIKLLGEKAVSAAGLKRAADLTTQWKNKTSLQLMAIGAAKATGVTKDAYGALSANGKNITLSASQKLNRNDYVPDGGTKEGFLLFNVTTGALKGLYKVDANKMTVS